MTTPLYLPMQANPVDPFDDGDRKAAQVKNGYVMEPKLDGWRCIAQRIDGKVDLFSRTGKSFTDKVPHIVAELEAWPTGVSGTGDFVLDGELGYVDSIETLVTGTGDSDKFTYVGWPIFDYNATARMLGSDPAEAVRKDEAEWVGNRRRIRFFVFDVLREPSVHITFIAPWGARRETLQQFMSARAGVATHTRMITCLSEWDEKVYEAYVLAGGEGVMLKNPNAGYTPTKRPANVWYKVKKFETMDVVIRPTNDPMLNFSIPYLEGQGKYEGQVGAILFGAYEEYSGEGPPICEPPGLQWKYLGKCSGMDDVTRRDMTDNWEEKYAGKVIEIRYFGKIGRDTDGLRHPQFIRMRPDKDPHECTM